MIFIDYSPLYYLSIAGTAIPAVTAGKFVQLRNSSERYLILSPKELTKYHANIVERFCMDRGIEGSYDQKREKYFIHDRAWQIIGGGRFDRDTGKKTIRLFDNSMAYGTFTREGLKETLAALSEFAGYTIVIE